MNAFGTILVWAAIQATLLSVATGAVYFAARRRQPGAGATTAWAGLLLCGALTVVLCSPWPNWSLKPFARAMFARVVQRSSETGSDSAAQIGDADASVAAADGAADSMLAVVSPATGGVLERLWRELMADLDDAGVRSESSPSQWPGWIACAIVLSMLFGGAQLLTGWFSVRSCLRRSRPLADPSLNAVVRALNRDLSLAGSIAVCESDDLTCAATVGSRSPVILLPPEWRSWSPQELRAVLAHELAHVAAADARTWLVAQIGLLLHFYHPLVHWLAQRLRLEQELCADAVAARLTGSSQVYLQTLASLAARHAARPAPWPLRGFLPSPGTLLRRIEMLRDTRQAQVTSKRWRRGLAGVLVVLCAVLVAGVRPEQPETAEAEQLQANRDQSRDNLKMIALALHNYAALNGHFPPAVLRGPDGTTTYSWRVAILPFLGAEQLYNQYDRSQSWDSEQNQKVLKQIPAVLRHPLDAADSTRAGYFVLSGADTATGEAEGKGIAMREFTDGTSNTLLAVEARRDIPWTKPEDLPYAKDQPLPAVGGWFEAGFSAAIADGSVRFLDSQISEQHLREVITRNGGEVVDLSMLAARSATAVPTTGTPEPVPGNMAPTELARLDLKKLGLAFHGYHDVFGHFPPPVLYGPDGKTPYSWRVELLPVLKHYVEGVKPDPFRQPFPMTRERYNALIAECGYDLSQPWDSEANRKVLAAIPDAYRNPTAALDSPNASYFAFTGSGTAVGDAPGKGVAIREFFDGTSNTLLLVEAQLDIPWTKPEDIPYQAGQSLTLLDPGELKGSHVLFADGHVKFMPLPADPAALRIAILRNDNEIPTEALKKLGLD